MPDSTHIDVHDIGDRVAIVASEPRFGPLDAKQCVIVTAATLGLRCRKHSGAFWSQSLMRSAKSALAEMPDLGYVLTVDYDSMFRPVDVLTLYALAKVAPDADAICACQAQRETGTVLMSRHAGSPVSDTLMRLHTGHFGLTLLKADKLRAIRGPWFLRLPGDDPDSAETVDEDIYFWHQWAKAGNTLYMAPQVRIGQLELVVAVPGDDYRGVRVNVGEWDRAGR